mgnify:CR=1 FL=1
MRSSAIRYYLIVNLILLLIGSISIISCGSNAPKGIPVTKVVSASRILSGYQISQQRQIQKKILKKMSKVNENRVFKIINGVPEYKVGPLDVLEINFRTGDKVTTSTITVTNAGKISYSFIDDLKVDGLTPTEIDNLLTERLSKYIKRPRIDVIVKDFKSKTATILGEFSMLRAAAMRSAQSGRIFLKGRTTLMDLIAMGGGYTENADVSNIKLIRNGKTYFINLYDIIEKGENDLNIIIDEGDMVSIPELPKYGKRVYVMGEVNSQGIYSLDDARDLLGAIALAGSFTYRAEEENTIIIRNYGTEGKPLIMVANLKALFKKGDMSQNIKLEDGDLIYIPRTKIGDINEWIAKNTPLLDFIFYPKRIESSFFSREYLRIK